MKFDQDLGQHFMKDEKTLKRIVGYADLRGNDVVLETGSGDGRLTKLIAPFCRKLFAVEIDRRFLPDLRKVLSGFNNVELINKNVLDCVKDLSFNKMVSNPSYNLLEPLLSKLFFSPPELLVLTVPDGFISKNLFNLFLRVFFD